MTRRMPRTPSLRLDGKRALVTGASRGIGLASAIALAEAGAEVAIVSRSAADLEAAADDIRALGGEVEPIVLDVTDLQAVRREVGGREPFDILVNAAGCNRPKPMLEVSPEDFDAVMDLNTRAAFFVTQAVAASLVRADKPGSLIHISSQMGHVGGAKRTAYCASKWALEGMSKAMAIDLAPYGIRSNTIAPTFVHTQLSAAALADDSYRQHVMSKIKLGRLAEVEDLMGAVVFLASDASAMMTGTSIVIDGGWTAG